MTVPPSLRRPDLAPVWQAAADRLARSGLHVRGALSVPPLEGQAHVALRSVLGVPRVGRRVELAALEAGLRRHGVGDDLPGALATLGFPVPVDVLERRAVRERAAQARAAFREAVAAWPASLGEWRAGWADAVVRAGLLAGLDAGGAMIAADRVRQVLVAADAASASGDVSSRTEIAARVLGSAHALDPGTRLHGLVDRALSHAGNAGPDRWERVGLAPDLVSAPVLVWDLDGRHPVVAAAREACEPVHLSSLLLRGVSPPDLVSDRPVLTVENPRVVEAAAQRGHRGPLVCANGNPSGAVRVLLRHLLEAGVTVLYHGDFDAAGLAICGRMHALGATPWQMGSADYADAVAAGERDGLVLPRDPSPAPATPWDPSLRTAFDDRRAVVHEERLVDDLLSAHAAQVAAT